jgi:hypothetical protein
MAAPLSDFTVAWSLHAEAGAERHQETGAVQISALRRRFGRDALVPDGSIELDGTDAKDKPILSAASLTGASVVATENIKDFGLQDLARCRCLRSTRTSPRPTDSASRPTMTCSVDWPRRVHANRAPPRTYIASRQENASQSSLNA